MQKILHNLGYLGLIDYILESNILPIIGTKADNVEGDEKLNEKMSLIAYEYDLPLWNFWLATKHLPHHGIDMDKSSQSVYLIHEAWDIKSYTALQTLYAIYSKSGIH